MSPKDMKRMKDNSVCKNNQSICFPLQEILIDKYINRPFSTDNTVLIKELFLDRSNTRIQSLPEIRIIQDNDRSIGEDFFNSVFYLAGWCSKLLSYHFTVLLQIKVITKLPNSEQSYKGKVQTHNYINRQNQSTTGKL